MAELVATTALGADTALTENIGGAQIRENPDLSIASIACRRGQTLEARNLPLPGPGEWAEANGILALWLGPEQWLMMAEESELSDRLSHDLQGVASVTDQTDAWVCFDLDAPNSVEILTRLTMLDVAGMGKGAGARGLIEHMGCLLMCIAPGQSFRIMGPRSSAASIHHALQTAATSIATRGE